ncbi:ferredoxin [Streptomyces violaceoruber]
MTYVIAQPCVDVKDKACIEECPVDCIYEGQRSLYIHPDECVDCGACEPVCPVEAIFYEDDTPEEWKDYYKANVEFFDELGSPGGATIITTVLQTLTGFLDRGLPLVDAIAAPRASQRNAALTELEPGLYDSGVRAELEALGHSFKLNPEIGAATAVQRLPHGKWLAAAEKVRRGGGSARVVEPVRRR